MKTYYTRNEAIELLERELDIDAPITVGDTIPHRELHEMPSLFQPRSGINDQHLNSLGNSINIESSHKLDPIEIWWSGSKYYVLDGHHRLTAYRLYEKKRREREPKWDLPQIPISVFKGTLEAAVARATFLNSKDKLMMTKEEKLNRAWMFVSLQGAMSKKEIAATCGISTTTVGDMRKQRNYIEKIWPDVETDNPSNKACFSWCLESSWRDAKQYGLEERVYSDEWADKDARQLADRFGKAFGKVNPERARQFARAFLLYSGSFAESLADALAQECGISNIRNQLDFQEAFGGAGALLIQEDSDF